MSSERPGIGTVHITNERGEVIATITGFSLNETQASMGQVDFTETTKVTITCKCCGSDDVIKWGSKGGVQHYRCKACGRRFSGNNALPGMRYPPDQIATALNLSYEGLSLNAIRRQLGEQYGVKPSDATVYEWVVRFTRQAVDRAQGLIVNNGDVWVVDETVLKLDGRNAWFFDAMADETRYLVGTHLSLNRRMSDAVAVLHDGFVGSTRAPRWVVTDGLVSYPQAVERVFGAATTHVRSQGFAGSINTNLIERLHGSIKQRTKVMRGMQNLETARLVMAGWRIHYNHFREHESLGGQTPGRIAGAEYPYSGWADVVTDGWRPTERRQTVVEIH